MIDLRSDTVTIPTPSMLEFMFKASVGDDVFGEDSAINELESLTAEYFGMEAGLFCPSGTMTNQIAIKAHTQPGDEIICDKLSHIYLYEGGGVAFNSGCSLRLVDGERGRINAEQVVESVNPDDIHKPISKLVSLENTSNRGGGSCYDFSTFVSIKEVCNNNNMALHLDGARILNAIIAKKDNPKHYGEVFNSISICFSKSLGAPVGSVLIGNKAFIKKSRRIRKVFGGGMRQAGYLAAACTYALQNNIQRLSLDHDHAKTIEKALLQKDFIGNILPVETNIIIAEVRGRISPAQFTDVMNKNDVRVMHISPTQIRMVLHLGISTEMVNKVLMIINQL